MRAFELHVGRDLHSAERAAFAEGYAAGGLGRDLPCPYRGELAPIWLAGRHLRACMLLRQEPAWPAFTAAHPPPAR